MMTRQSSAHFKPVEPIMDTYDPLKPPAIDRWTKLDE